jgi:hypothetical protein
VSTKHLSFVETGRSSPSRQLLVHLAQYLEQPYDGEVTQPLVRLVRLQQPAQRLPQGRSEAPCEQHAVALGDRQIEVGR